MRYEGKVYRPPSEAYSLIIQVTIGCSHNKCTFCSMYKEKQFRVRDIDEIIKDLELARKSRSQVKRIFLADGNALILKPEDLKMILEKINELFPECERVGIYSAPKDILLKSVAELKELKQLGLDIAYLGIESGSDKVLKQVKKGVTSAEIIEAGQKMMSVGINLSVTLISGLGGIENWKEHAVESARVVSQIDPDYLALLTLLVEEGTEMHQQIQEDKFKLLTPKQVAIETRKLIENLDLSGTVFRSNHASNYISLAGTLPQDKEKLLAKIDQALENESSYKDEIFRSL